MPDRYRKKPVVIDAEQITADNLDAIAAWTGGRVIREPKPSDPTDVLLAVDVPTLEGTMRGSVGDWMIRGVRGEFYPCKPDIFSATYEPAPPAKSNPAAYLTPPTKES